MSNPSIANKLLTIVKGIFGGGKGGAGAPTAPEQAPAAAPAEAPAAEKQAEESAAAEKSAAEEKAPAAAKPSEKGAAAPAEEPATGQVTDDEPEEDLVAPEEKPAVAAELDANETATQAADRSYLDEVRKAAAVSSDELPVPGYDEVTLPSIRARLRKLTLEQVRTLRTYELANQERPEFIKMYDNRIAKLTAEDAG
ncbi:hypothetical protein [Nocardiopsis coralliicola]